MPDLLHPAIGQTPAPAPAVAGGSATLFRKRLVEETLGTKAKRYRAIVITAQAGQGKTTLIHQFLWRYKLDSAWHQITLADKNAVDLLAGVCQCLSAALPRLKAPLVRALLAEGNVTHLDLPRLTKLLFDSLHSALGKEFYLVLDDLHLLGDSSPGLSLLGHLLTTAPPLLRFVLASRLPVPLTALSSPPA